MDLRLRELREDRELRQIDVALATDIDQKTLSNYETGKTLPDIGSMCRLADYFGVTLDFLAGRTAYNIPAGQDIKKIFSLLEEMSATLQKMKKP